MRAIVAFVLLCLVTVPMATPTPRVYGRLTYRVETGKVKNLDKDLLWFSPLPGPPNNGVNVGGGDASCRGQQAGRILRT